MSYRPSFLLKDFSPPWGRAEADLVVTAFVDPASDTTTVLDLAMGRVVADPVSLYVVPKRRLDLLDK